MTHRRAASITGLICVLALGVGIGRWSEHDDDDAGELTEMTTTGLASTDAKHPAAFLLVRREYSGGDNRYDVVVDFPGGHDFLARTARLTCEGSRYRPAFGVLLVDGKVKDFGPDSELKRLIADDSPSCTLSDAAYTSAVTPLEEDSSRYSCSTQFDEASEKAPKLTCRNTSES